MKLKLTRVLAVLVSTLALFGLFNTGHLFELTNTDIVMDITRLVLATLLIYAGFISKSESATKIALFTVGFAYFCLGLAAAISSTCLGEFAPSGFTEFDILFHLAIGGTALWASSS